jgi:hypothetical protein
MRHDGVDKALPLQRRRYAAHPGKGRVGAGLGDYLVLKRGHHTFDWIANERNCHSSARVGARWSSRAHNGTVSHHEPHVHSNVRPSPDHIPRVVALTCTRGDCPRFEGCTSNLWQQQDGYVCAGCTERHVKQSGRHPHPLHKLMGAESQSFFGVKMWSSQCLLHVGLLDPHEIELLLASSRKLNARDRRLAVVRPRAQNGVERPSARSRTHAIAHPQKKKPRQ